MYLFKELIREKNKYINSGEFLREGKGRKTRGMYIKF
jgi:hypothetical protein